MRPEQEDIDEVVADAEALVHEVYRLRTVVAAWRELPMAHEALAMGLEPAFDDLTGAGMRSQ